MNVVFASVVYPGGIGFLPDFLRSVNEQSYKGFEMLLINDGIPNDVLQNYLDAVALGCWTKSYDKAYSPGELRIKLLLEAREMEADIIIMGDFDDIMDCRRIEKTVECFENTNADFVYNSFYKLDRSKAFPELPQEVIGIEDIMECNFLGLSNTAIKLSIFEKTFIESFWECKSQVFDWYLFNRILLEGFKGYYADGAVTYYGIYDNNYIGIPVLNTYSIDKEVRVKKEHYRLLQNYSSEYEKLATSYENKEYEVNENQEYYYWWNLTRRKRK